jgi:hypothetical protein
MLSAAQEQQRSGQLRKARAILLQCAKVTCAGDLQKKCAQGATKLKSRVAWVAPVVTDAAGEPVATADLVMDGQPVTNWVSGHVLAIDPGIHEFSVDARVGPWPGRSVSVTRKVMIIEGQRGAVSIPMPTADEESIPITAAASLDDGTQDPPAESESSTKEPEAAHDAPAPVSSAPPPHHGPSPFAYVLGGAGLLGIGAGALLTYWGKTDNDALAQCSPNCQPASVDHVRTMFIAADISFGAGALLLGSGIWILASSHSGDRPSAAVVAPQTGVVFDVAPTRSGAMASVQGVF